MSKLTPFLDRQTLESYTYLKSPINADFEPGRANLTPYNARDKRSVQKGVETLATDVTQVAAYSNLCGLFALDKSLLHEIAAIHAALLRANASHPASYD